MYKIDHFWPLYFVFVTDGDVHVGEEQLDADGLALWQHYIHHGVLDEAGLLAGTGATLLQVLGGGC